MTIGELLRFKDPKDEWLSRESTRNGRCSTKPASGTCGTKRTRRTQRTGTLETNWVALLAYPENDTTGRCTTIGQGPSAYCRL